MARSTMVSNDLLQAALSGLELQRGKIDAHIAQVRGMLGKKRPGRRRKEVIATTAADTPAAMPPRKRARFSAETRARMAAAQRKRWANVKGVQPTAPAKSARKKRRISLEGRKRMADAARRPWAAMKR